MSKTAVVTGASKGLGQVVAIFLARSGYDLVVTARHADPLEQAAMALRSSTGRKVIAVPGDVSDAGHRSRVVSAVTELGGLDVLVNNASELGPSPMPTLDAHPLDDLERVFAVNVIAPIALTQQLLPFLRKRRGLVVNVTSDAAVNAYPTWGGYGSSKAALEHASRVMSAELDDVTVVAVDPGDMRTDMHQDAEPGQDISHLPTPEVTVPFWAWLLAADRTLVHGQRFEAQGERWTTGDAPGATASKVHRPAGSEGRVAS